VAVDAYLTDFQPFQAGCKGELHAVHKSDLGKEETNWTLSYGGNLHL
jgi:hypothetical protein